MADLSTSKTALSATGASQTFTAPANGMLVVKLWGGGGAGGMGFAANSAGTNRGGAAGFTHVAIRVTTGQVVRFDVGKGGQGPQYTSGASGAVVGAGGAGGWPDGGDGGVSTFILAGGGGGSSRVYVDGVLQAVAAAGGGQGQGDSRFLAGGGGGLIGQINTNTLTNNNFSTGGTQAAGGVNQFRNDATSNGASLQGGHGYGAGGSRSTTFANAGGGGGGGYYGGAGGGVFASPNNLPTSGAGGSSFIKSTVSGRSIAGDRDVVGGTADADYANSAGLGGLSRSTPGAPIAADNGTDGRIVYTFTPNKALPAKIVLDSTTDSVGYVCATEKGVLAISMWGGGGSACTRASGSTPGGGAGYTRLILPVVSGDVVQFDIGKGGIGSTSTTVYAPGGWPDGGAGGKINTANYGHGSGGGSTRVWLNGVLVGVAGAGGSSGISPGGAGGGPIGYTGITAGGSLGSSGGTQSAGGTAPQRPSDTAPTGKFLQGGDGWADSTASTFGELNSSGGGGGGGYYGGGGGSMTTAGGFMPPGGGGSSYINQAVAVGYTQAGIGQQAGGLNDPNYNANMGRGGYATTAFSAAVAAGGGGAIVAEFSPTGSTLPSGTRVTVDPIGTGSIQHFKAAAAGTLAFSLWGAGGGGATRPGAFAREGGPGGYTTATSLAVAAGDIISVEVGRGGKCPSGLNVNMVGGWPDGGHGGLLATTGTGLGSGGGSTRLYKNGVLMAVAGGGGGAGLWPGGGGGGLSGIQDTTTQAGSPGATNNGTGGTQSAGGVAASRTTELSSRGSFLQGGMGWADNVTGGNADWSGGGGGGGYYGGGGGSYITTGGGTPSGGGGSSFIHASITGGSTAATASGAGNLPQGTGDTAYVKGRGVGGVGSTGFNVAGGNGTDGAASLLFTASGSAVTQNLVQNTPTMLVGVPGRQTFTAPADGLLVAKLWGGGGGGGLCSTSVGNDPGGGGGFTYVQIPVTSGQVIDFDVADGGQGGQWAGTAAPYTTSTSGLGGWPDGGNGGGNTTSLAGGGGGSTRLYIAGVLKAVAGGGGGTGQGDTRWQPGAGGGNVGQDGTNTVTPAMISTGGTQSAGGTNSVRPADTTSSGGSLQGGNGYPTGGSTASAPGVMVGGGGGGGYYGGAGGGNNTNVAVHATSGGGGSSYVAAGVAGYTVAGSRGASGGITDVDCPYGIGNGGASKTTTGYPDDGGAGAVHYVFVTSYNTLPENTKTTLASTNQSVFYKATTAGVLSVKMWGGGGGGGAYSGTGAGEPGAGAGYTTFDIPVTVGQVIRFDPGSGGKGAKWAAGVPNGVMFGNGGAGGWPDGGAGGTNNRALSGGGGGSSRLWIDNVLISVAAGGGGDGLGEANRRPGAGGGLTGQNSANTLANSTLGYGTGGTQTAGGTNLTFPTDRAMAGAFLSAGRGYGAAFPPAVHSETSGGGGGGGYYGGGAGGGGNFGGNQTVAAGGAGGSSYVNASIPTITNVTYQTKSGYLFTNVGGQDDPDYVYKVGLGGSQYLSTTNPGAGGDGGDGAIIFTFLTTQPLVEDTPTAVPATGVSRKFIAAKTGTLKIKMWGGAGSAGTYSSATGANVTGLTGGANGGYTYAEIEVVAGQVVQIDVGKGAGASQYISGAEGSYVGVAAAGGWPDGGPGYHNLILIPGGGGGSSRVWVDGVLKAVAGAGGGGAGNSLVLPGGGGARVGQDSTNTINGSGVPALGGTQARGGVNNAAPTNLINAGSYLRGGAGGQGPNNTNRWTADSGTGFGGGGGYFGGAGGGQSTNYVSSGAGGSGYLAKDVGGYMESANYGYAAGNGADADLPAGCAVGGKLRVNANGVPGGDGHVVYTFVTSAPTPNTKTVITDSAVREYIVAASGPATFKLWGGGGGGSNCPTGSTDPAAAGGFTTITADLTAGQRLRFEVGQGGEGGNWVSGPASLLVGIAGRGGFPDGGSAGFNNQAIAGGGGGSSRVWLDGKLLAVAGGGGAQGVGLANRTGGVGGGVTGGTNQNTPRPAELSSGGTQTAGGTSAVFPSDIINQGAYLRGGDGFAGGLNPYVHSVNVGGGAGGGYYGGAGGACTIQAIPGGGGGSGYLGPNDQMTFSDPDQGLLIYYNSFDRIINNDDLYGAPTTTIGTGVSLITPSTKFASGGMLSSGGAGFIKAILPRGLGLEDFTLEGWFKHDALATGSNAQVYFEIGESSAGGLAVFQHGNGNIYLRQFSEGGIYDQLTPFTPDLNWHHLAVVRDSNGMRLYRDGVLLLTHPTLYNLTATGLLLGSYTTAGASIFNGKTDEFRIFSGKARYTTNFTPPATPMGTRSTVSAPWSISDPDKSMLLYYNSFDRTIINDDLNGAPTAPQGYGVTLTYPSSKFGTGGMVTLPGTGHLKSTLSQGLDLSDFTIEGWFKHDVLPTGGQVQVYFTTGEAAANGLAVYCQASTISLSQFGGTYLQNIPFTNDLNWHHLALVRDATSTRLYRDGVLIASHTNVLNLSATVFNLGNYQTVDASIYRGQIDEVRVFKGKARYTANFTPPATPLASAVTTAGAGAVPGGSTDPDYVAGVGVGGASRITIGKAANGGNGRIVFTATSSGGDANASGLLPVVTVTPPAGQAVQTTSLPIPGQSAAQGYTGATYSYQASVNGTFLVEMWGAGGGGVSASGKGGGGGGYTTYQISLVAGDVVTVQVPSGGGSGTNAGSPPGAGGYPDGGTGFNPATLTHKSGGGGSARLYINGVLAAVAGGGGGGSYGGVADDNQGGPGGGSSGVAGTAPGGAPGTQSAGGAGVGNGLAGAAFQGGNGGTTPNINSNGPGGGGGYYGGGGGGQSGGGGSGYINTAHPRYVSGTTTAGTLNQPAGTSSVNYVSGVGVGSVGTIPGGSGRINIYNNTPTPGNASGASNTVTVSPPVGGVDSPPVGAITIGTVLVNPPVATAGVPAFASGSFGPEVTMGAPSASAAAQAIVIVPINDSTSLHITAPTVAPFSLDGNIDADIATVFMIAPTGFGSVAQNPVSPAAGDIGTITVVPGEGAASIGQDTIVPIDVTVTVTPPAGTATGQGANSADRTAPFSPEWITIRPPGGSAATYGGPDGNAAVSGSLPVIPISPPQADFVPLDFIIEGLPSPIVMTLAAPEADGAGNALIVPEPYMDNGNPANWYYSRISLVAPVAYPEANADFTVADMPRAIIVGTPTAAADLGIDLLVPLPAPIVINGADADPTVDVVFDMPPPIDIIPAEGSATGGVGGLASGDLVTIDVTSPEADVVVPNTGTGDIGTITVSAPLGVGMVPASAAGALPTIVMTAPLGSAEGGASADATGDLSTITVSAPLGGNVANAAVSLPLGTVFVSAPAATPSAGTNISRTVGTVTITPPLGRGEVPGAAAGDIGIVTVVSPEGVAYEAIPANASGDIGTVLVTAPDAAVEGNVAYDATMPVVYIYAPNGRGEVPADVSADIATIIVEPALGTGTTDVVNAEGELPTITLTEMNGDAFGNSLGVGTLPVLTLTPPASAVTAEADLTTPINLTIQMVAPQGIGYPVIPASAEGDLPSILITASDGTASGAVLVQQPLNTVTVNVPVASPSGGVDLITARELAIIVGAPVGEYYREAQVVAGFPTLYVYVPTASVEADGKTASASGVFPVIYIDTPDGFAEVPVVDGTARIKFRRSVTRGAVPASLMPREIAFNEIDGTLLTRDGIGAVHATPLGTLQRLPAAQGTEGTVLRADGTWGAPAPTYPLPVPMEPTGSLVILADGVVGTAVSAPTIGATIYRPFFVPRTLEISALAFTVVAASTNTVEVGVAPLSLTGVVGAPLVAVSQIVSGTGVQTVAGTAITLEPGWYASTFKVTGAGSTTFRAAVAPSAVAADFSAVQGAPAYVSAQV